MDKTKIAENWVKMPKISEKAFVDPSAEISGEVIINDDVMVAPHVSIRADEGTPFYIGKGTNIQDSVTFHGLFEKFIEIGGVKYSIYIGTHVSIAHNVIIHGPTHIAKKTFVGFRATIHHSVIGRNCFIDFHAVIKNATIGEDCYVGINAVVKKVIVPKNRYIKDGEIVNTQEMADRLPLVTAERHAELNALNKDVVDFNKTLLSCKLQKRLKS
jgi:carbon dioxide concentrating mechanism protein CcmM